MSFPENCAWNALLLPQHIPYYKYYMLFVFFIRLNSNYLVILYRIFISLHTLLFLAIGLCFFCLLSYLLIGPFYVLFLWLNHLLWYLLISRSLLHRNWFLSIISYISILHTSSQNLTTGSFAFFLSILSHFYSITITFLFLRLTI